MFPDHLGGSSAARAVEPPPQSPVEVGSHNVLMAPDVEIDSAVQRQAANDHSKNMFAMNRATPERPLA